METYVVMVLDTDEDAWASAGAEERQRTYDADKEFIDLLAERGGKVVGGAELTHSRRTRNLTGTADAVTVTDGPYAETTEHLSGFYVVECPGLEALTEACAPMLAVHARLEVRPTATEED